MGLVVLTVAKVTGRQAPGYAEYLDGKSRPDELGDYYLKDGERVEAPGRWAGGATAIGMDPSAAVTGEQLRTLMQVRRPDTGGQLRAVGASGEAVAAIDATFSAPKSVSALWALASPQLREHIERAHELAVERTITYAIEQVRMVRERISPRTVRHTRAADVIATSWRHTTARAVADQPPDPQLHSHLLLHAAIRPDGRVVAIDSRAWFVHRRELGASYRTELAHELSILGFEIERGTGRGARYFEITGVPQPLLDRWSSRHHQVQQVIERRVQRKRRTLRAVLAAGGPDAREAGAELELLERTGRLAPGEDRHLTARSRVRKDRLITHGDLDRHWLWTARRFALDAHAVQALRVDKAAPVPAAAVELVVRLTEFDATFPEREARAVALEACAGVRIDEALGALNGLRWRGELLELADGTNTTRAHRAAEQRTVRLARQLAAREVSQIPAGVVERQILVLQAELRRHGAELTSEQRDAIRLACSGRQVVMIEGHAGTGKSTTLLAIARAHQADGRKLVVTSTAALAAQRVSRELDEAGVSATAFSTRALEAAIQSGRIELDQRTTVIHDEAALASTREQHQLLDAVQVAGARLIEIGDPRQSQAVGAGGLWPDLEAAVREHHARVELTRNVRAREPDDRRDQKLFRDGAHEQAIAGYHARGRVKVTDEQHEAEDAALEGAYADRAAGKRTIVIAQTSNEHLDELNARAQAIRLQHGELGEDGIAIVGRPYELHQGDDVQLRRSTVHPLHGWLMNGTTGQVRAIDPASGSARIELAGGIRTDLDCEQLQRADIRLAYVQHSFPAQGQTTDTTHLIIGEQATQEGTYVGLTRARERTTIHTSQEQLKIDDGEDLLPALAMEIGRTEPELPSVRTPLAHEQQVQETQAQAQEFAQPPARDSIRNRSQQLAHAADRSHGWAP